MNEREALVDAVIAMRLWPDYDRDNVPQELIDIAKRWRDVWQARAAAPTSDLLAVTASELYASLKFIRTHLYAAQAQMNDFDDAIISRHVYDAYKRTNDVCREIAVHGVSVGRVEE